MDSIAISSSIPKLTFSNLDSIRFLNSLSFVLSDPSIICKSLGMSQVISSLGSKLNTVNKEVKALAASLLSERFLIALLKKLLKLRTVSAFT